MRKLIHTICLALAAFVVVAGLCSLAVADEIKNELIVKGPGNATIFQVNATTCNFQGTNLNSTSAGNATNATGAAAYGLTAYAADGNSTDRTRSMTPAGFFLGTVRSYKVVYDYASAGGNSTQYISGVPFKPTAAVINAATNGDSYYNSNAIQGLNGVAGTAYFRYGSTANFESFGAAAKWRDDIGGFNSYATMTFLEGGAQVQFTVYKGTPATTFRMNILFLR